MIFKTQIMQISKFNGNKLLKIQVINQACIKIRCNQNQILTWIQDRVPAGRTKQSLIPLTSQSRTDVTQCPGGSKT